MFVLVSRNGESRSEHVSDESAATLQGIMRDLVDQDAEIMTDQHKSFAGLDAYFQGHERATPPASMSGAWFTPTSRSPGTRS